MKKGGCYILQKMWLDSVVGMRLRVRKTSSVYV